MDISIEVRTFISETKNKISNCKTSEEMMDIILQVVDLLSCKDEKAACPESLSSSTGIRHTNSFKKEFLDKHYSHFCEFVLKNVDPKFLNEEENLHVVLRRLFMEGPADLSFLVLASSISSTNHTTILQQIVSLLDHFASRGKFVELFFSNCVPNSNVNSSHQAQDVLMLMASLPDQLANKMKLALNTKFHPKNYYKILGNAIVKTLMKVHKLASCPEEYTTSFLSNFVGKVALRGSVDVLFDELLPQFKTWSYTSPLWLTLCSQTLMDVPESALEPVLETLLRKITLYPFFSKLVKDSIHTNTVVNMLITHKFLFVRYYKDLNVLKNLIGYLSGAGRRDILMETLKKLIGHWGNYNTIKHTSYPQQLYITQALILSAVQASDEEISKHKQELLHKLLSGVQAHLENPNSKIRHLGMITAECLTSCLHPGSEKLQFEYEEDDEVERLRSLAASPKFGTDMEKANFFDEPSIAPQEKLKVDDPSYQKSKTLSSGSSGKSGNSDNNIDGSDGDGDEDDLQPFEMSEDDHDLIEGIHPPKYISECIEGLLSNDDHKKYIASLRVVNKVIMDDQDNLPHLSVQLVTVLLHLQDKYSLGDYNQLRFSGMVSATVACPLQVSDYLTREFYAPNYSLRQRMDILDVLAAAAAELSKPLPTQSTKNHRSPENVSKTGEVSNWQLIIQERLEKKTRRFSKKGMVKIPKSTANRFAPVAGHFFFPLLQGFDSRENTLDLLGEDCMVLGSLVCTVGNIMYCARGAPVACNMAKCLLEFVWVLRYHNDSHVRQALLFAVAMAVLSVPEFFLMNDMQDELLDCQNWLENILSNDPSAECRNMALQVLVSVRDVFKRQFNSSEAEF